LDGIGLRFTSLLIFANIKNGTSYELSPVQLHLLQQDLPEMSYTWENENELIDTYRPMIFFVANKMKIANVTR